VGQFEIGINTDIHVPKGQYLWERIHDSKKAYFGAENRIAVPLFGNGTNGVEDENCDNTICPSWNPVPDDDGDHTDGKRGGCILSVH
jgi:hypothetical protein